MELVLLAIQGIQLITQTALFQKGKTLIAEVTQKVAFAISATLDITITKLKEYANP